MLPPLCVCEVGAIVLVDGEAQAALEAADVVFEKVGVLVWQRGRALVFHFGWVPGGVRIGEKTHLGLLFRERASVIALVGLRLLLNVRLLLHRRILSLLGSVGWSVVLRR